MSNRISRRLAAALFTCSFLLAPRFEALAEAPKELRIAAVVASGPEAAWDGTFIKALADVAGHAPHGLKISYKISDPLWGEDAGKAMRLYAESGQFDVIWAHSSYSDQIKTLKDEFPNIMFVVVGSGNEGLGGNQYWVYKRVYEPAYLLGILAGKATKTNVLGVVGTVPADDSNDEINAFLAGAKSVNPVVVGKVAFIDSWYDPAKAAEYLTAQTAAGADLVLNLADNFAPCEEKKIVCFANFRDDADRSKSILSSPLAKWQPDILWIVEEWYKHRSDGTPFVGNTKPHAVSFRDGGSDVASFHGRDGLVPASAIAALDSAKAKLMDGTLTVPLNVAQPASK